MWRSIASNGFTILIMLGVLLAGAILWGQRQYVAEGPLEQAMCLRVASGSNMRAVSHDLEETGAVSNGTLMRIGADYAEKSDELKAGAFLVPAGASMEQIVDIVTRGGANTCGTEIIWRVGIRTSDVLVRELDPATNRYEEQARFVPSEELETPEIFTNMLEDNDTRFQLILAEGVTSWQVQQVLNDVPILSGDEVEETPAEGSLAPQSYSLTRGDSRTALVELMQSRQNEILTAAWEARDPDLPLDSPEELLTIASIIEKETAVPGERTLVASVFENRLRRGMRLQTDPTVIYGVTNGQGVLDRGLRRSELDRVTPYNTYQIDGLPPGPIANPGRAAIEAAVHPADTEYVYFVADGTGGHAFAATLAEHNANVARWREIERETNN
ncbi:endolytic transglycosylase MltG [Pseudooceanicola sp. HF7]|uniref:endolytic transglycosylase MltG n=1 Tax=Pseudooceanicola sp. HF7 TaxID=2721560 RepID=UPI001431CC63|nr:endolytic transglycosylase MltG [Pseudooceanicola sp. HF7]NIZ10772.1 endolytic transglycosylase MltG [Pseudooceanicola sp. HF7]